MSYSIETVAEFAQWWESLKARTNDVFLPLFLDKHRYLVLKGGGGSGKSIFAGQKILERCTSEPGHRFLVCRKVGKTLRESCFKQLCSQALEYYSEYGVKINKTEMSITFGNGSVILTSGLDDVEKLKSIYNITGIWIEEASELLESDFNQLDIRLRGETRYYKQIIISFNPISITHWLKKRFFDKPEPRAKISETTYKDNRFLDAENIQVLEGYKDSDEYYYQVYCLGMWGVTGRSVFDGKSVTERLLQNIPPVKQGYFEFDDDGLKLSNIRFIPDRDGPIKIYTDRIEGVPYVLGGDTAGDGSDSFVGQVLDNRTGQQVCVLRHQFDEDQYARQMYCLGEYYNNALIGIENNFSSYPTMELERLRYPKMYVRETVDNFTHQIKHSYGFWTDSKTRPIILSELIKAVREDITIVSDKTTLEEMLTFVRNEAFKPEAEDGAHDDCVMALAIAHHIRPQQDYTETLKEVTHKWTESMWEDYRRADKAGKEYLRKKWGAPRR